MGHDEQGHFNIFIGDYYSVVGRPILFVTSHSIKFVMSGRYCAEYFVFFENDPKNILSKRFKSEGFEIKNIKVDSDFLFEHATQSGRERLLNLLYDKLNKSTFPVSLNQFKLRKTSTNEFRKLSIKSNLKSGVEKIQQHTQCKRLQKYFSSVLDIGKIEEDDITL